LDRYPDDPYDRAWIPWSDPKLWFNISTKEKVEGNVWNLRYHAPSTVMQTAITTLSGSKSKTIEVSFDTKLDHLYPMPKYTTTHHLYIIRNITSGTFSLK
jgi:hypothetical protein